MSTLTLDNRRGPVLRCRHDPDHAVRPLPLQGRGNLFGLTLIRNRLTPATETLRGLPNDYEQSRLR